MTGACSMEMSVRFAWNFFRCLRHVWVVMVALLFVVLLGALAISRAEGIDIGRSIYFAFVTGLTIGYGDITPMTTLGRIVSVLIGVVGVLYFGLVIGVSTRALMLSMHPESDS